MFYEAWDRFNDLLRACPHHGFLELHQLDTFYNALNSNDQDSLNSAAGGNFLNKMPRDCLRIIESKSKVRNSCNKPVVAKVSSISSTPRISPDVIELKDMVKALLLDKKSQAPTPVKAVEESCVTCGGAHSYRNCPATNGNVYRDNIQEYVSQAAAANYNLGNTGYRAPIANQIRPPDFPPDQNNQNNQGTNQNRYNQGNNFNQNRGNNYNQNQGNNYNQGQIYQPPVNQPPVHQAPPYQAPAPQTQGTGTLPSNTVTNPRRIESITTQSGCGLSRPMIPTISSSPKVVKRETEVTKDTVPPTNNGSTKDSTLPVDLSFQISLTDALILMPKFASTLKALIGNKEKLSEMARIPLNEHCSAVILNKLPKKLGDPGKFLIQCNFPRMDECLALADLGASINLMPLSVWKRLSLPELTPTCMTLELADRSITQPIDIVEDVYVKVGKFHFPADFVVGDFDADLRVPLILGRSFLKTGRALIDIYKGELTLRVRKEAVTFNLDQTSRYSFNYNDMTANRIDVIEMACEEYSQEVIGFSDGIASGNPTPYYDPIIYTSSSTLTPSGDSDFLLLEEADAFLALEDDPNSPKVDDSYYDSEEDILLLEAILNTKSSIDEPLEVELKDLPPYLEYTFLEDDDKLPIIIAKDLSIEEKVTLIKILMKDDYKPEVQHQRRVNPKIHDVIKKEVEKLLDAGLIYLISDSPWVSPVHCVPKKGGFTVVANDENELIPTRLVTGWRVCIDYRKLNEATRKDHFPLPFMDQMLERLAGNDYYCFLDGFSGYFQIPIDPKDQEKTTFTCPYGTFAYRRMPFGLCNAPGTFQRCMLAIFHDMVEKTMEEKSHFMVKEGIVLGHKISKNGIEVDKAKVDVIAKLPHPTTVKGVRSFLGHAEFDVIIRDKKGAENLTVDHLSRLENPHQDKFENKEITETFSLETLGSVALRVDSTLWFADFANYHAGNFIVKGISS
ncbi:reverse transcriptase domain-containing protein [Tanacetum coccineum]